MCCVASLEKKFFFIPVLLQGFVLVNKLVCLLQTSPRPRSPTHGGGLIHAPYCLGTRLLPPPPALVPPRTTCGGGGDYILKDRVRGSLRS